MDNLLPIFLPAQPRTPTQALYAAFPAELKSAMKAAAKRNNWTPEDWELQTQLIHDTLAASASVQEGLAWHPATLESITAACASPPPELPG